MAVETQGRHDAKGSKAESVGHVLTDDVSARVRVASLSDVVDV